MQFVNNVVKRIPVVNGLVKSKSPPSTPLNWPTPEHDIRDASWSAPGVSVEDQGPVGGGMQAILVKRPELNITSENFQFVESPIPELPLEEEGAFMVVQNVLISLDPTHRLWIGEEDIYMPRVGINNVMRALTVAKVTQSNSKTYHVGDYVLCFGGVQQYALVKEADVFPITDGVPLSANISVFNGLIGLTAWVVVNICNPKPNETMVVSGAYGAVGSLAVQIGKARGAKVIGVAGGETKCKWLTEVAGCDGVIDYKSEDVAEALKRLAPEGVDCFFDNTGGPILAAVMLQAKNFARIALCGLISKYNSGEQHAALPNYEYFLHRRISAQGFLCFDHLADIGPAMKELSEMAHKGQLKYNEHLAECKVEEYVDVVNMLYTGKNTGKLMMKIADYEEPSADSEQPPAAA